MSEQPGRGGLLGHDLSGVPPEEVRFGVVLNGGVSLAVWMGGVALELDRLVKAQARNDEPYAALLRLTGCSARVDVISGTSAGGVNGAALALAQVNRRADIAALRDVWVEQGRIEALLRQPFRGAPSSLLKGDEHFLPQLNAALTGLAVPTRQPVPPAGAPIDLPDDAGGAGTADQGGRPSTPSGGSGCRRRCTARPVSAAFSWGRKCSSPLSSERAPRGTAGAAAPAACSTHTSRSARWPPAG